MNLRSMIPKVQTIFTTRHWLDPTSWCSSCFQTESLPSSQNGAHFDPGKSRIKALQNWDQEEMRDEQDDFFEGADKVLLDYNANKFEDDLDLPEQVLNIDADSDQSEMYEEEPVEESPDTIKPKKARKPKVHIDNSHKGRFGKEVQDETAQLDDKLEHEHQSDSEKSDERGAEPSEDEDETWKSYHVSTIKSNKKKRLTDPDAINQDAERQALELEEVKRLQIKARLKLGPTDFASYLDYASEDELAENENNQKPNHHHHSIPQSSLVREFTSEPEAIAFLINTKPESLALLNDFCRSLIEFEEVQKEVLKPKPSDQELAKKQFNRAVNWLHYHVLSTYLSTTSFYMYLALKIPPANPTVLTQVIQSLVDLRTALNLMEQLGLISDGSGDGACDALQGADIFDGQYDTSEFDQELRDLLYDQAMNQTESDDPTSHDSSKGKRRKRKASTNPSTEIEDSNASTVSGLNKKKKKRSKKESVANEIEVPNSLLLSLPPEPSKSAFLPDVTQPDAEDDFIEPTSLSASEARAKQNRKRELRFYTTKIDAKGKRRERAMMSAGALGGDTDLPYISKEAKRREFLQQQDHSTAASEKEFEADSYTGVSTSSGFHGNEDIDYYSTIKELKQSSKIAKKAEYDQRKLAARDALSLGDEAGSGPREITRQILKNKGLTPKRPKENRNPRVKKRLRFEKAKQKISSQRPSYKPDQAAKSRELNGYSGEKTGVKVGIVKSRKL
ncbi:hypothetical protein O181_007306 [Austropuccinia psidii MF-1]|uniref:Sas10 C-terminal domain-containing protein n=1 Tax=Austropuccinia psidii MF-1 TaxID=1389203 RepID=A0A9Q3GHH6_9BASI|nr:hypothetical protein [Austropuccinia psidii MF-1]